MALSKLYKDLSPVFEITEDQGASSVEIVPINKATYQEKQFHWGEPDEAALESVEVPAKERSKKKEKLPASTEPASPFDGLRAWIEEIAKSGVNEEKVKEIISKELSIMQPRTIEVKLADTTTKIDGLVHFQFELVLKAMSAGVNLALAGSTATSKTTMAVQSAKALGKEYMVQPVNEGTTKADILGYCTATGSYVPSLLYTAMKEGRVLIIEEIDCGSPASLLAFNNAVDNRELSFPNGELLKAHEGFMVICTMNTKGTGADRKFVGRNRLDAATLDRFCILEIERDFALEAAIIGISEPQKELKLAHGGLPGADVWLQTVREKRGQYEKSHPDKIVSMRAVRDGWKLIQAGIGKSWATKMCIDK